MPGSLEVVQRPLQHHGHGWGHSIPTILTLRRDLLPTAAGSPPARSSRTRAGWSSRSAAPGRALARTGRRQRALVAKGGPGRGRRGAGRPGGRVAGTVPAVSKEGKGSPARGGGVPQEVEVRGEPPDPGLVGGGQDRLGEHGALEGREPAVDEPLLGAVVGTGDGDHVDVAVGVVDVAGQICDARVDIRTRHVHEGVDALCCPRRYHIALGQSVGVQIVAIAGDPLPHLRGQCVNRWLN